MLETNISLKLYAQKKQYKPLSLRLKQVEAHSGVATIYSLSVLIVNCKGREKLVNPTCNIFCIHISIKGSDSMEMK